ncbi:arginine/serine-rich protein PNISR isoform X3 [Arabidopsis lyrata subsp. lyrata]|nr:arginine/serine-rich protein PNISR isoform X3 [Arabidopsis lyrata subsp. lyrata]|eukprot:XP_020891069.1 arginine/serine-rich protein PNISR isoform X3 [Arabidopsis lyrata subsp. lyrata]
MQYAYGDQSAVPPSNLSDQPVQFSTRENSDYSSVHNAWQSHTTTGVVYPPIPSSVQSIPQNDSSMAIPPVSGHIMPPYGRFPPPNLQPVGPPYAFATKPPLHPVTAFMDDSYAASSVPPKKAPVPNWLKEELLKKKADLGRPSSGSFEGRESMDDDVLYKPPAKADQRDEKSFSPSKSSDGQEEEDEDEMDAARTTEINMEIKRILTEVLLKVTDELFDEIATKVINEDEAIPKDDSVQHNHKTSSSLLSTADPLHKASAKILVSVEGANNKASSGSPADVLGLASYASDDDDADTDAASNADADENDGVESLGVGSRHDLSQRPSTEKLSEPEAMANAKLDPKVDVNASSGKNSKSGLEDYSQMPGSRRKDDEAGSTKISDVSANSGLAADTSGSRKEHPDRTDSDKDAVLDEPHGKNSGLKSDCNLRQDSNKTSGKDLSDEVSTDRSRTDETKGGKEKVDSQNGSKDRMKENDLKSAEKVKGVESNKKSTDPHVKKDSRDVERPHITNSKEDRGKKKEKEKEEERSRHRRAESSSKDKRRRSPTSNESSDDSKRKSRSRRRNVSPSPVRSRRRRSSPSSDELSDDSRRKSSSSKRRNRSPSPGRSRRRHVSSRSPHSKHSQHKHTLYSSHEKSRSKRSRSRSRSPHRRHRAK